MPSLCQDLKVAFERLQRLTTEFTLEYNAVKEVGDLTKIRVLRKELEKARDAILGRLPLIVPDAINPYHKALREAGLGESETQERQEITVHIPKEIRRQLAIYGEVKDPEGRPFLEEWVCNITENVDLLYEAVAKDREKIIKRIKAGMIQIVMPSREVQERTWKIAMTKLKPVWFENGVRKAVVDNCIVDPYSDSTNKMTEEGFFNNIPNRPYLVWIKPTQKPDSDTCNKYFDEQRAFYDSLVKDNPDLYDQTDLIPTEYGALQAFFTASVWQKFKEIKGEINEPRRIVPLDIGVSTRFLSAGKFSDADKVPCAIFIPSIHDHSGVLARKNLIFGIGYSGNVDNQGIRPASRS